MDRKYDTERGDEDDDFEATHSQLAAYVREGQAISAGQRRLIWEQKIMRRIKKIEMRLGILEDSTHSTVEIAAIAQKEVGPAKRFVLAIIHWRDQIVLWAIRALVGAAVVLALKHWWHP